MTDSARISMEKKTALFRKYLLLAQVAETYAAQGPCIRALRKIVLQEQKTLKSSRYPMDNADLSEALETVDVLARALSSLLHAKKFDSYRLADEKLSRFRSDLATKIADCEAILKDKPSVQNTIDAAVNKAKEIGAALGVGVEQLKKTVKDLGSK